MGASSLSGSALLRVVSVGGAVRAGRVGGERGAAWCVGRGTILLTCCADAFEAGWLYVGNKQLLYIWG